MKTYKFPAGYNFFKSIGRTIKQVKNPIGAMEESMKLFHGTYSVSLGTRKMIATQDPGFMEHVLKINHRNYHKSPMVTDQLGKFLGNGLLTSNGEFWLKQRRLIQPGFHMDKIKALYEIIKKTVDDFLKVLPTGEQVDVYPLMNKLAFEIVINTLFDVVVPEASRRALNSFINETQAFVVKDIRQPYFSWWFRLSGEVQKHLDNSQKARSIIRNIIQERKLSNEKFNDLLDMLLDARYEDTGESMNEERIIDEILVMIIAGHETTGNALSWMLYLLVNHPNELEKLKQETKDLDLEQSVRHDRLNAVINETMRLYPPAWISDRIALNDDVYQGYTYPKGSIVLMFYYGLHRDSKFWSSPESFLPDRFLKQNIDKEKQKAFYPFGAGPRLCIGNNFAMAEMAIFIQTIIHNFEILPTDVTPIVNPLVTLRPDKVLLKIRRL
jgi:cytochrome P450